ncbi:MAG: hypothetical protein Q7T16_02730 [Candidatus Burarchaeum sp.]|nr:hypothetical protein [Candidatus Burarchaeum sp.]MDO8339549.1 hypothetical protein [Candidatus Burarchaeum sp.]
MSSKKGFVFTVDAFVALTLVVLVIFVIVYQLNIPSAFFPQQSQTYNYARDVVSTLSTLTIKNLKDNNDKLGDPLYDMLLDSGYAYVLDINGDPIPYLPITTEDDHTVLEQIAKEARITDRKEVARLIAVNLLASDADNDSTTSGKPMIPEQFGVKISIEGYPDADVIVRDKPFTKIQSSASYVLMGYTASRDPRVPRYDYPSYVPENRKYCSDGTSDGAPGDIDSNQPALPCAVFFQDTNYEPGAITETPLIVRVSVWT